MHVCVFEGSGTMHSRLSPEIGQDHRGIWQLSTRGRDEVRFEVFSDPHKETRLTILRRSRELSRSPRASEKSYHVTVANDDRFAIKITLVVHGELTIVLDRRRSWERVRERFRY